MATTLLAALPALLVATAAIGFHFTTTNPFNPLQLQNPATWTAQVWNIAGYYACLLPFFFLAGVFVSLSFVLNADRIGQVYGYDLTGAGAGAALVLAAMFVVHAFFLVPLLLVPLAASACFVAGRRRWAGTAAAAVALLGAEALLLLDNRAEFNDFKAIYAPLHTPDAHVVATVLSPRGDYALLDDFTERVDTDISNNAGMLGVAGPPQTFGLYRDGNRIAALPKPGALDVGYAGRIARRTAVSADPACERAAGRRLGRLPDRARSWRSARRISACWSRSRSCCARWSAASARRPRGRAMVASACRAKGPWRRFATAAATTSSTCRRISSTPRRPTRRHSRCRHSRTTCER